MTQDYRNKIGEIIGEASMCWSETPTGVFDSDSAVKLIDRLESLLKEEREKVTQELVVKTDIELRRILAEELPKLEEKIRQEERNTLLNRAWEYVVKASREEHGSKEDFIKFVNEEV